MAVPEHRSNHSPLCAIPPMSFLHTETKIQTPFPHPALQCPYFVLLFVHPTLPSLAFLFLKSQKVVPISGPCHCPLPLPECSSLHLRKVAVASFLLGRSWVKCHLLQEGFLDTLFKAAPQLPSLILSCLIFFKAVIIIRRRAAF